MSLFLFALGTSLKTYKLPIIDNIPGQDNLSLDSPLVTFSLWFQQDQQSRSMPGVERGISRCHHLSKLCSLPVTCSFPVDKLFSFSVPGMVAWWHSLLCWYCFRHCYFNSQHHYPLLLFLLLPQFIPTPAPLHVTTVFIISQHFPGSLVTAETIR